MKVSELGEFGLIDLLAKMVHRTRDKPTAARQQLIIGIGDDAAVWHGDTSTQLATTDLLIQGVHFPSDITPWKDLGWRAMAANLSDIAAMGGVPKYALISLALPANTEVENVTDFYQGMIELAQQFDVAIVGGDTSNASLVIINITILGSAKEQDKPVLTRSAARADEKIAVTGYLGAAAAGVRMLKQHLQFDPEATACFEKAFLHPYPRIVEGQLLVDHGVKAAIDISDGLILDLKHICEASQVGARIEIDRVPIQSEVTANFGDSALELALAGGEDYELLFTASEESIDRISKAILCPVTVIGNTVADNIGQVILVDREGKPVNLPQAGWEHFTAR